MIALTDFKKIKNEIKNILTGQVSKRTLTHVLGPLIIIMFITFIAVSWILYPNYNWTIMNISYLGDPYKNPFGWIFWSIAIAVTGFLLILIIPYFHRRLFQINKIAIFGTFFQAIAIIGMIGVGIIPQFEPKIFNLIHVINSACALGGLY